MKRRLPYTDILVEGDKNNDFSDFHVQRKRGRGEAPGEAPYMDASSDSKLASKALDAGRRIGRMFDAKNSLVKKGASVHFEQELKMNENRIWWEHQEDHGPPVKKKTYPPDRFRNIY